MHDGTSRCAEHKRVPWVSRTATKRRTGAWLQAERAALFREHPFCGVCRCVVFPATAVRDHIVPLAEGGADDRSNTQLLCPECNATKTKAESLRGRGGVKKLQPATRETDPQAYFSRAGVSVGGGT